MHLFLTCFGGPLDRVLLTFWRMHTLQAQRLPDRDECTTILRWCVEHVFGSWRQRALLPQMFATCLNLIHIAWSRHAKEELDRLSFLFDALSSRHLLKPLTRPKQSDMPQLRLCQCRMSMLTRRRSPSRGFATCGCHSVATWRFSLSRCFSRLLWKPCYGVPKLQAGSCVYCVGNRKAPMPHVSVLCARSSCFVPVFWSHASESLIPEQLAVALMLRKYRDVRS